MKRNPSIHIKISDLENILREAGVENAQKVAAYVLQNSKKVTLSYRMQMQTGADTAEKIKKLLNTNELTVEAFNSALINKRISKEGGGFVQQIRKGGKDYAVLSEIAGFAYEFFQLYKFETEHEAYTEFIEIGLRLMGKKYAINKFISHLQNIFDYKKYQLLIDKDTNAKATIDFYQKYQKKVVSETGLDTTIERGDYLRFIDFYYGRIEADNLKAKYTDFILAQFEEMSYLGTVPERYNLHGATAKDRYFKWLKKQRVGTNKPTKDKDEDYLNKV